MHTLPCLETLPHAVIPYWTHHGAASTEGLGSAPFGVPSVPAYSDSAHRFDLATVGSAGSIGIASWQTAEHSGSTNPAHSDPTPCAVPSTAEPDSPEWTSVPACHPVPSGS